MCFEILCNRASFFRYQTRMAGQWFRRHSGPLNPGGEVGRKCGRIAGGETVVNPTAMCHLDSTRFHLSSCLYHLIPKEQPQFVFLLFSFLFSFFHIKEISLTYAKKKKTLPAECQLNFAVHISFCMSPKYVLSPSACFAKRQQKARMFTQINQHKLS